MTPIELVYHRIRWDPGLDASRFVIGYDARAAALVEIPFVDFAPGGDIPWHRVLYLAADGEVVWDRRAKLDRVGLTEAGRATRARVLGEPLFTPRAPHRFDAAEERWVPAEAPAPHAFVSGAPTTLRVLTWNILFDRYDAERIETARRHPRVLRELEAQDADVIALQEVERASLKALLAEPWVRARYTVSDAPSGRSVDPYGVVLLSRLPVLELGYHALGRHKQIVAMVVAVGARPRVVATAHLTSDHASRGAEKRRAQLAVLREALDRLGDVDAIVLGDFNERGELPSSALDARDVWTELVGDDTPTFDPRENPLAALVSLRGEPLRLDRVLARAGADVRLDRIARIGTTPEPDGLFPSDHYGLVTDVTLDAVGLPRTYEGPTSHRTALAWLPPEPTRAPIDAIRREHDPRFERWMPHVNVLYGFAPEHRFDEAAELVSAALADVAPFACELSGVGALAHRDDATLYYDPQPRAADGARWRALAASLLARFPACDERHRGGFRPHLTLGRVAHAEAHRVSTQLSSALGAAPAPVGALALLSRRGDEPMRVRATVELGTGDVQWLDPLGDARVVDEPEERTALAARVTDAIVGAAPPGARIERIGSRRMGCAIATSDLDLLWIADEAPDVQDVAARIARALGGEAEGLRLVRGARVPGVKLRVGAPGVGALGVDLAIVHRGADEARVILSGLTDADAVLGAVAGREAAFSSLARVLKAWARAKGFHDAALGGLPGLAWAVLAARAAQRPGDGLAQLFGGLAAWDPRVPITLERDAREGEACPGAALTLPTPTPPSRNLAGALDAFDVARLQESFYAAWELALRGAPLERLLAPPPFAREHAAVAQVLVRAPGAADLEASVGWVRGHALALLRSVRAAGAFEARFWPRPLSPAPGTCAFALGLGRAPIDAHTLAEASASWIEEHLAWPERASGVRVEVGWMEGGALPSLV